jgi:hypothetical protein
MNGRKATENDEARARIASVRRKMTKFAAALWPHWTNPEAGVVARFGRLVHWVAVTLAALFALLVLSPGAFESFADGAP